MNVNQISHLKPTSSYEIVKNAISNTHKHFIELVQHTSFCLLLVICMFVPLWVRYTKILDPEHFIVEFFEMTMYSSFIVVVLFTISLFLFNKTHPDQPALKFWKFMKEVSWPWLVEGLKSTAIIIGGLFLFIIPGFIKAVHYMFLSFVVFFNQDYKEGKVNALKHSKKLSKGLGLWIFMLTIVIPFFIKWISESAGEWSLKQTSSLWIIYPSLTLQLYAACVFYIYCYSILYFMYTAKEKAHTTAPAVSGESPFDSIKKV